jgi:hypothetical protein
MAHRKEPSGTEVLRLFYYIMGQDQAVTRADLRRETDEIIAQSTKAMARSRALLERFRVERSVEE